LKSGVVEVVCTNYKFIILALLVFFGKDLFAIRRAGVPSQPVAEVGDLKKANDILAKAIREIERSSRLLQKFDDNRYNIESGFKDKNKELKELMGKFGVGSDSAAGGSKWGIVRSAVASGQVVENGEGQE
jgi:hypothetical protein